MPNSFERRSEPDTEAVSVTLYSERGLTMGHVSGPLRTENGLIRSEVQTRELGGQEAVAAGVGLANRLGVQMVVIDPEGLWQLGWGALLPASA